jgi:hypothetical protein
VNVDKTWSAVLDLCRELGPIAVQRSRFANKPALFVGRREFAHWDGPGLVDLRITAAGWRQHAGQFADDAAVQRDSTRRDWIDLQLTGVDDVERLRPLFETAIAAND